MALVTQPGGKRKSRGLGYDFSRSVENIKNKRFVFGPRDSESVTVDATLAMLFEALTVECSGILVHPQWKHYRHIKMDKNERYRLSNGIWRSWHMQFQKGLTPLFCQFDMDPSLEHHKKHMLAVVLEGKYWKRKVDAVANEYRKWRVFYRDKLRRNHLKKEAWLLQLLETCQGDELGNGSGSRPQDMQVDPSRGFLLQSTFPILDDLPESMLIGEPRGTMDFFQPNLDMLNPNPTLDELLDRLDPMDFMLSRTTLPYPSQGSGVPPFQPIPPSAPQPPPPSLRPPYGMQPEGMPMQISREFPSLLSHLTAPPKVAPQPLSLEQQEQTQGPSPYRNGSVSAPMGYGAPGRMGTSGQPYPLSPTALLSLSSVSKQVETSMELGSTPQSSNYALKPEPEVCPQERQLGDRGVFASYPAAVQASSSTSPCFAQDYPCMATPTNMMFSRDYPMDMPSQKPVEPLLPQYIDTGASTPPNSSYPGLQGSPVAPAVNSRTPLGQHGTPNSSAGSITPQGTPTFQFPTPFPGQSVSPPPPLHPPSDMPPPSTNPFNRVSSAGNLCSSDTPILTFPLRPPLEKVRSEPTRSTALEEHMRELKARQDRQLLEIEKQQSLAQRQYIELLQQYLQHTTAGRPTEQQQQVLQSVLSDPSLVTILKSVLLSGELVSAPPPPEDVKPFAPPPVVQLPTENSLLQPQSSLSPPLPASLSPPPTAQPPTGVMSPSQLAKVTDFQSRLVMAAAAQANSPLPSSSAAGVSMLLSPYGYESDATPSPKFAFSQAKLKSLRNLSSEEKEAYKELRRQSHITAEQKRRGSIKQGFEHLQSLVVDISAYPSGKVSKAAILEKTIEHIRHTHLERDHRERQMEALRREIEELNTAICRCQEQLPAAGAPITRQRFEENRQRFREYVQTRTLQNYKFWIFSIILQQLFDTYNSMVSTGNADDLCRTVLAWFEQNCSLPALRPVMMRSLRELSVKTSILSDPSQVPQQLTQYAKDDL